MFYRTIMKVKQQTLQLKQCLDTNSFKYIRKVEVLETGKLNFQTQSKPKKVNKTL